MNEPTTKPSCSKGQVESELTSSRLSLSHVREQGVGDVARSPRAAEQEHHGHNQEGEPARTIQRAPPATSKSSFVIVDPGLRVAATVLEESQRSLRQETGPP